MGPPARFESMQRPACETRYSTTDPAAGECGQILETLKGQPPSNCKLQILSLVACLLALTMVAPLLPDRTSTLMVWFLSVTLQSAFSGSIIAGLHSVTPNRARAFSTAIVILLSNIIGLALGTAIIGAVGHMFFEDVPRGIGFALAIVNTLAALVAAGVARAGMSSYRRALAREHN